MDLLANYNDENTEENSISNSPSNTEGKSQSKLAPNLLENEWLSFEQMIAPGGGAGEPVKGSDFLVNGIVAYPGMKGVNTVGERSLHGAESALALEEQSSASSDNETAADKAKQDPVTVDGAESGKKDEEDDDAFFKLRKQVKEQDRSDSSDGSGSLGSSSASSSRSVSPSPPHLSPVNSIKSHTSEPPDLTGKDVPEDKVATGIQDDIKVQNKKEESTEKPPSESKRRSKSKERKRSRSKDRKRSHRDHRSKHDHSSSKSKRRHSRSRSKDRRHRHSSRDRHRHKDKKSRDRKSSRSDEKRSKSRERKDKSESRKSEGRDRKDSKSEVRTSESHDQTEVKKSVSHETKGSKSHRKRSRSRSKDRKDKKKDRRRSRSHHRHRSRSKDRRRSRSKEWKRSKSRERRRKHRSRSRYRSRERHSRSRSRERLRSRSPVLGRKLTFKEQMRKEFIMASKEMASENKALPDLTTLRKPGEALRTADLLKGMKLTCGESVTPQMALIQTMAAMHKKAQELTGVEVPKYYNPAAVNPLKYAEQVQKRKLLWSKKSEEKDKNDQMEAQWKSAFVATEDNNASKFRKLMGMKEGEGHSSTEELPEEMQKMSEEQHRKNEELFQRLDHEYQFARMTTHTQRGVGLGFATTVIDPNHPQNPP